MGGFANAIFLVAASLFIVLDAIERFIEPKPIERPVLVLVVAFGGMLINLIGIVMFCVRYFQFYPTLFDILLFK